MGRRLAVILLPIGATEGPATGWALVQDRARELSAVHDCRVSVKITTDQWGLPWATITSQHHTD